MLRPGPGSTFRDPALSCALTLIFCPPQLLPVLPTFGGDPTGRAAWGQKIKVNAQGRGPSSVAWLPSAVETCGIGTMAAGAVRH